MSLSAIQQKAANAQLVLVAHGCDALQWAQHEPSANIAHAQEVCSLSERGGPSMSTLTWTVPD
jgi:hypothetical protein